jgi:carbamoyl-phosphate synthase small subunit
MKYNTTKRYLLSDGTIFTEKIYRISGTTFGEVCFNTGMTGYQEILPILLILDKWLLLITYW